MSAHIRTQNGCKLRIARYPTFTYGAKGGGGPGQLTGPPSDGRQPVSFDCSQLSIPAVNWRNTRILGVAPIIAARIAITPTKLQGYVEQQSGRVQLEFQCTFNLSVLGVYHAPPLEVNTQLTTESMQGRYTSTSGQRMNAAGECVLVGTTGVPKTTDRLLNSFLTLPTEAFALMRAVISLDDTPQTAQQDSAESRIQT